MLTLAAIAASSRMIRQRVLNTVAYMRLGDFILANLEAILAEWEHFARGLAQAPRWV